MYNTCVPGTCGGQQEEPDPLELELQAAVSHYVGSGNKNPGPLQEQVLATTELSLQSTSRPCLLCPLLVGNWNVS